MFSFSLDIFATAVSITVWNLISAFSAKKRHKQRIEEFHKLREEVADSDSENSKISRDNSKIKPPAVSYVDAISIQREATEAQPAQLGA